MIGKQKVLTIPIFVATIGLPLATAQAKPDGLNWVEVIGWTAKEDGFAVRRYHFAPGNPDGSDPTEDEYCPGYVDHQGKRFVGSLAIEVFVLGTPTSKIETASGDSVHLYRQPTVERFEIQGGKKCTSAADAKKMLAKAKAAMAKAKIRLNMAGQEIVVRPFDESNMGCGGKEKTKKLSDVRKALLKPHDLGRCLQVKNTMLVYGVSKIVSDATFLNDVPNEYVWTGTRLLVATSLDENVGAVFLWADHQTINAYQQSGGNHYGMDLLYANLSPSGTRMVLWESMGFAGMRTNTYAAKFMGAIEFPNASLELRSE